MLHVRWLSPCACLAQVACDGNVNRVLFLSNFVETGDEYEQFRHHADIVVLTSPSLTNKNAKDHVRTLASEGTVQLLSLIGVHSVESCQVEERVLLTPTIALVPYANNAYQTSWVLQVKHVNLLCFSPFHEMNRIKAKHYLTSRNKHNAVTTTMETNLSTRNISAVPLPEPTLLFLYHVLTFPKICIAHTLPSWALEAVGLMKSKAVEEQRTSSVRFFLQEEVNSLVPVTVPRLDWFTQTKPVEEENREWVCLEGASHLADIQQRVNAVLKETATLNGLVLSFSQGHVEILGQECFRIQCTDTKITSQLADALLAETSPPCRKRNTNTTTEDAGLKRVNVQQPDASLIQLLGFFEEKHRNHVLLSELSHEAGLGDKRAVLELLAKHAYRFVIDVNSDGKRRVTLK